MKFICMVRPVQIPIIHGLSALIQQTLFKVRHHKILVMILIVTLVFFTSVSGFTSAKTPTSCQRSSFGDMELNYSLPIRPPCGDLKPSNGSVIIKIPKLIPRPLMKSCNRDNIPAGYRICRRPDCLSGPCVNGWCEETMEAYLCHCPEGFSGKDCSIGTSGTYWMSTATTTMTTETATVTNEMTTMTTETTSECPPDTTGISDDFHSLITCQNERVDIVCPPGEIISILSANYGRTDPYVCPHIRPETMEDTSCFLDVAQDICQPSDSACNFEANKAKFGDPCYGTFKYLNLTYMCIQAD